MIDPRVASPKPRTYTLVQALRGIAAAWVMLYHAGAGGHIPALQAWLPRWIDGLVFRGGHYGVSIFFALSGFVIAHSLVGAALTPAFLGRFALRRSIRLDPPYWGAIVIVLLFGWLGARVHGAPYAVPTAGRIAAHMAYSQELLRVPELNPAFWTLTYEVQFYLFLAAMLVAATVAARAGLRRALPAAWAGMTLLALAAALNLPGALPPGLFVPLWPDFFIGVLAYHAVRRRDARIGFGLLFVALLLSGPLDPEALFPRISAATALLLLIAARTGYAEHGLRARPFQWLGAISYSLYLLHNSLTGAAALIAHRVAGQGVAADLVTLLAVIAASIGGAAVYWALVERGAHRLSRRVRLPRRRDAGIGAATPRLAAVSPSH